MASLLLPLTVTLSAVFGTSTAESALEDWENAFGGNETLSHQTLTEVSAQVGQTVFLPCPEATSDDSPVWIRRSDYHILARGSSNYIKDQRFQVMHSNTSDGWTLLLRSVETSDNGTYECQVSSGSGYVSWFVRLHVFQPVASIPSGPEYHVQQGTAIQLVCVVQKSPTPPKFVLWYHGDAMVNYDKRRRGLGIITEAEPDSEGRTLSRLTIADATLSDSGNYSCQPSNTDPASVWVFVSKGDKIAAIQGKSRSPGRRPEGALCALAIILVIVTR